jgi:RsiW-degrading membrane proteinase PrsW (M82 family)
MEFLQILVAAIFPPILVIYYLYKNDLYEKEPHKLIFKTFLIGCLVPIPVLLLSFDESYYPNKFYFAMFGVAFFEEGFKFAFLRLFNYGKRDFNEPYDGIFYAVTISMGFALVENILYVFGNQGNEMSVAILRCFTAIPLHAACGVVMGYYVGKTKIDTKRKLINLSIGLIIAIIIHGLYNYFLFAGYGLLFSVIVLIIAIMYSNKAIKIHQSKSPFKI